MKEHLEVCREEDDDVDILELSRIDDLDSDDEDDEENVDDPDYNTDSTSPSGIIIYVSCMRYKYGYQKFLKLILILNF